MMLSERARDDRQTDTQMEEEERAGDKEKI